MNKQQHHVTARTEKQASKKATYKSSHRSWVAYTTYKAWGNCSKHVCDMRKMRVTLDLPKKYKII